MEIQIQKHANGTVMTLIGRMDTVTAPEYDKKMREILNDGETRLVIDFEQLDYISSAGLRGLLTLAKLLKSKGGALCFANVTGNVKSVFDMSGFNSLFRMEDTLAAALAALG